tara:strand:+ start:300 stop:893 length:594 start_codon:yes stop_codon:yes gene_type:complete
MHFPIFPLNGAILFPKTNLPLNIFEERYISMVDYALSNKRLIGMIQLKKNGDLFNVGCLGKITSFNETKDGRYLINLEGTSRFNVNKELNKKYLFRVIDASVIKEEDNKNNLTTRLKDLLLKKYQDYLTVKKINIDLSEIKNIETDQLVKFIIMISPFDNLEKQMLLEVHDEIDLYNKLCSILDIEIKNLDQNQMLN